MTPYEMMLSESQERMLMVLKPGMEAEAEAIFVKWGLDFAVIGRTTDTLRFVIKWHGETVADLPIKELGDEAPLYDRPHLSNTHLPVLAASEVPAPASLTDALKRLVGSPDLSSKRWVFEQYDHFILGNTVQKPGGDAAIVRVEDGPKGLALTCDVTPRYCEADPVEGGRQAVAEAWRNITAVGAKPLAITDNLNFGNPEKPEVMGQLVGCLQGIGEACRALDFPRVRQRLALQRDQRRVGTLPTPTIGGVARVTRDAVARAPSSASRAHAVAEAPGRLPARAVEGREEGAPPPSLRALGARRPPVPRPDDAVDASSTLRLSDARLASPMRRSHRPALPARGALALPRAYLFGLPAATCWRSPKLISTAGPSAQGIDRLRSAAPPRPFADRGTLRRGRPVHLPPA